jgi:hypothetical protein
MYRPTLWRQVLGLGLLMTLVVFTLSACGSGGDQGGEGGGQDSAKKSRGENPLVGTWRRVRKCEEQVRLMKEAGLEELIPKWVAPSEFSNAAFAQGSAPPGDPCKGVRDGRLPHDHVFYKDGRFASVDDQGEFVDDGSYEFVDERTIEFADPPGNLVHFRFGDDFDTVTFDVTIPDMDKCSKDCRMETAYRLAVFYPGLPWKRVPEKEEWPGEE